MKPHPDFADNAIPRTADLGGFRLTPLSPAQVDEDLDVVCASEAVLVGLSEGDWPRELTREENLVDLAWHEREFTARRSFAWIVRDTAGVYLGCAYLYPEIGARGRGTVVTWIRDMPERHALLPRLNTAFGHWIAGYLPADYRLAWASNDRLP